MIPLMPVDDRVRPCRGPLHSSNGFFRRFRSWRVFVKGLEASGAESAGRLVDGFRHLSVLVEVADTVTRGYRSIISCLALIDLIVEALGAERATLFLHDADAGELFFAGGSRRRRVRDPHMPQGVGIAGSVFGSGVAEIIDDVYRDPRFNPEVDRQPGYRTRAFCASRCATAPPRSSA